MPKAALSVEERRDRSVRLRTRGIHHLVFNTDDMKMTIDFYQDVLGMPLVNAFKVPPGVHRGNPPFECIRHYFFDMGNDSTLAFFELPKGTPKGDRDTVATMQHCSFAVSAEAAEAVTQRLTEHGIEVMGPIEPHPGLLASYFFDPNGIRLEMTWRKLDTEGDTQVMAGITQPLEEMLAEVRTLHDDPEWLAHVSSFARADG